MSDTPLDCNFCFDVARFAGRRVSYAECPLSEPDCPDAEQFAFIAWLRSSEGKAHYHHRIRAGLNLPCDRECRHERPSVRQPEIGESLIQRIKSRLRLEDEVERLTEIRWRGDQGMGKCPFHDDRGPSLSVSRGKQVWHCFAACGGGDVITWLEVAKSRGLWNGGRQTARA